MALSTPSSLRQQRLQLAAESIHRFSKLYLRHHFYLAPATFHPELMSDISRGLVGTRTANRFRYAAAIPQGYAKSMIGALALPIWSLAFGHARHIAMVCASRGAAAERMRLVQRELETNDRLRHDFPHLRHLDLRGGSGISRPCDLIIAGGLRLVGMYRLSPVATLTHNGHPPDLLITDDLDGQSKGEALYHAKTCDWWDQSIEPALGETASLVMLGTPRRLEDLLLHRVIRGPDLGWTTRRYRAITGYPEEMRALRLFEHIHDGNMTWQSHTGPAPARAYLDACGEHGLYGGTVAWPEKENLRALILLKARIGWTLFDSLKQCHPPHPPQTVPTAVGTLDRWFRTHIRHRWTDDAGLHRGSQQDDARCAELLPEEAWDEEFRAALCANEQWNQPPFDERQFFAKWRPI